MSRKTLLFLALIILVLALIIGGMRWWKGRVGRNGNANKVSETLERIDPSQVAQIVIKQGESSLSLSQQEGVWRVDGKRADAAMVKKALDTLRTSAYEGPISRNPENYERLGVREEALLVTINEADNAPRAVRIGKSGPTYNSSYVKIEGNDEVYLANANLSLVFPLLVDSWRDKTAE